MISSAHIYFTTILRFSVAIGVLSALVHLAYNFTLGRNRQRVGPLWTLVIVTIACLAVAGLFALIGEWISRRYA